MGYRGVGGFAGDLVYRRRRRAAGDVFDSMSTDSSGFDPTLSQDTSGLSPDFSDVTGGSSSVSTDPSLLGQPGGIPLLTGGLGSIVPSLGGLSGAIQQFMGGGGSAAAAGLAAATGASGVGSVVKRLAKKYVARLTGGRAHRRMNPGNFHALRRSMRRLQAFEHAAKRVYHFTHPARGKSHFKFHRKRRR